MKKRLVRFANNTVLLVAVGIICFGIGVYLPGPPLLKIVIMGIGLGLISLAVAPIF